MLFNIKSELAYSNNKSTRQLRLLSSEWTFSRSLGLIEMAPDMKEYIRFRK